MEKHKVQIVTTLEIVKRSYNQCHPLFLPLVFNDVSPSISVCHYKFQETFVKCPYTKGRPSDGITAKHVMRTAQPRNCRKSYKLGSVSRHFPSRERPSALLHWGHNGQRPNWRCGGSPPEIPFLFCLLILFPSATTTSSPFPQNHSNLHRLPPLPSIPLRPVLVFL